MGAISSKPDENLQKISLKNQIEKSKELNQLKDRVIREVSKIPRIEDKKRFLSSTHKLLVEYDRKFNRNLDKSNKLNTEIMTKEKLITLNNEHYKKNYRKIGILSNFCYFLIISFILLIFYKFNLISFRAYSVISAIVFVICLINIFRNYLFNKASNLQNAAEKQADDFRRNFEKSYLSIIDDADKDGYKCPVSCETIEPSDDDEPTTSGGSFGNNNRFLKTDSSRDVWKKGDLPEATYVIDDDNKKYKIDGKEVTGYGYDNDYYSEKDPFKRIKNSTNDLTNNKPSRSFQALSTKGITKYDCKYVGGDIDINSNYGSRGIKGNVKYTKLKNSKIPVKKSYNKTTIPCSYYPGFKETGRYVCNENNCKKIGGENKKWPVEKERICNEGTNDCYSN